MIDRFSNWCLDQQQPYGFIIWMFVVLSTCIFVSFLLMLIAVFAKPVFLLAIPVLFLLAFIYSLYKVLI
jgi:hypothetical protein